MYLKEYLDNLEAEKIRLYVDMDGVIADYIVGEPYDFDKKRPLISNIEKLEDISKMNNVEMHILSISKMNEGIKQKEHWLDKYAPFFKKENRVIIAREKYDFKRSSSELKNEYILGLKRDASKIVVIDDDPIVLRDIKNSNDDVILLKDTALVD